MNDTRIRLFIGDAIADPSEQNLISQLQRDLVRLGVPATLYANFFPAARESPQVDLLIRTATRTAHVEVKGLNRDYPVRGRANGPWVQLLPDGTERSLVNAGPQALTGTYAISDAMRSLARKGSVTAPEDEFKRHIDSIVGMWQTIPDGSDIDAPPHVTVLSYPDLLQRLITPGPVMPWTDDEWDAFVSATSTSFQPDNESAAERRRRDSIQVIADYRLRARTGLADGLGAYIDLGTTDLDGATVTAHDIDRRVHDGGVVAVVGPSGCGKSFLAQHPLSGTATTAAWSCGSGPASTSRAVSRACSPGRWLRSAPTGRAL